MSNDLLLYTQDLQQAKQEIVALGGRVTQQFTDIVIVVNLPDSVDPQTLQQSTTVPPSSLDSVSQLAVNAWNKLQLKRLADEAPSATEGLSWDTPGYSPPRHGENEPDVINRSATLTENLPEESTGTPTSRYMVGSIAVGVVIVSGTQSDLAFSTAEQQQVIQEVQEGLNFLASAEPRANITFVYDIRLITVSAAPGSTDTYESAESPWRDAALQQMGFPANRSGSVQYVQDLRSSRGTDWAYVAYFTKYPLHHFAYAVDEKVCMSYFSDGWGSDQINRVFAHESCHIFGAADEYGNCSCGGSYGHLGIPNNNCVKCSGAHVSCLMDANVLDLCQWSRAQIGWDERLFPNRWEFLGGAIVGSISAVSWSANRLDLFVRGTDNAVYHKAWDGANWYPSPTDWEFLGGGITEPPVTVAWGEDRLDIFVRGLDGAVYHKAWDGANWYPSPTDWEFLGGAIVGSISAVSWSANRLDLFVRGTDNAVYHKAWDGANWYPSPTDWEFLGGGITEPPVAVAWGEDRLDIFVRGLDGAVYHKAWDGANWYPSPTDWEFLGGAIVGSISAVSWSANRLDLFVRGTDNAVYHKAWDGANWYPSPTDWEFLGGGITEPPVTVAWGEDRLDIFVRGLDGAVYHKAWDGANWYPSPTDWEFLGGSIVGSISAVSWSANRLDLFVRGTDNAVYHKAWDGASWYP